MASNTARKGLGKGLSALLGDEPIHDSKRRDVEIVSLTDIEPNPDQPRKRFTPDEIGSLAASIREKGILQPILVRPNPRDTPRYEIVAGERRWRAAQQAALHEVPVLVQQFSDTEALEVALIENIQRVDLNPMEEAESYARLIEAHDYTQEQLAAGVSKSRSHIANMLRLMKLPVRVCDALRAGELTMGHARALVGHPEADEIAREIIAKGLSVRETEARVSAEKRVSQKTAAPAKDTDTVALEGDLAAALNAKVTIKHGTGGNGTIQIAYKSLDQLDELCERFGL